MLGIHLPLNSTPSTALALASILLISNPVRLPAQERPAPPARSTAPLLRVVVVEGEGALNNIGLGQAKDPVVRIEDDDGRPIPQASVTFLLPDMGPSGRFGDRGSTLSVMSDDKGIATGHNLKPNNIAGQFQIRVTASYGGKTATATITQTNAAPRVAAKKRSGRTALILALVGGGGVAAALALRGGGGQAAGAASSNGTVVVPGSPVFGPPR